MRKPMALANWKMKMTISESLKYLERFQPAVKGLGDAVEIVLCPPYTALYPVSRRIELPSIKLGAQNVSPGEESAHTGEISAELLADVGCEWVLVGHWELRRHFGETDEVVRKKVQLAFEHGLKPHLLIGEPKEARERFQEILIERLSHILTGLEPEDVARMAITYEPEWSIGMDEAAPVERVDEACRLIRRWLREEYGDGIAQSVRIMYGGSVTPENARALLQPEEIDGVGAGRKGRDPMAFAEIVRIIAEEKAGSRG